MLFSVSRGRCAGARTASEHDMELKKELEKIRDTLAKITSGQWTPTPQPNADRQRVRCEFEDEYRCENNTRNENGYCNEHAYAAPINTLPPSAMINPTGTTMYCISQCGTRTKSITGYCSKCKLPTPTSTDIKFSTIALIIYATSLKETTKENIAAEIGEMFKDIMPEFNYNLFMQIATKGMP